MPSASCSPSPAALRGCSTSARENAAAGSPASATASRATGPTCTRLTLNPPSQLFRKEKADGKARIRSSGRRGASRPRRLQSRRQRPRGACRGARREPRRAASRACRRRARRRGVRVPLSAAVSPALADFLAHRGDPLATARAAVLAAPHSAAAQLVEASLLACSRDARHVEAAGWGYARLSALELTAHEDAHLAAVAAALDGDLAAAARAYDQILAAAPHDLLALAVAQTFDYYLGNPASQLERTKRALEAWRRTMPGYHAVLAMHAYALQECGAYEEAEAAAYRALALQPWDIRAHHAAAHVMEMQGRFEEGI